MAKLPCGMAIPVLATAIQRGDGRRGECNVDHHDDQMPPQQAKRSISVVKWDVATRPPYPWR